MQGLGLRVYNARSRDQGLGLGVGSKGYYSGFMVEDRVNG